MDQENSLNAAAKPTFPYSISFPDFPPSDAITSDIERYMAKLETFSDRIIGCTVAVRAPHLHQRTHNFHVHIHLQMPEEDLYVTREPEGNRDHADIHISVRDAFQAMKRQLSDKTKIWKARRSVHAQRSHDEVAPLPGEIVLNAEAGEENSANVN